MLHAIMSIASTCAAMCEEDDGGSGSGHGRRFRVLGLLVERETVAL